MKCPTSIINGEYIHSLPLNSYVKIGKNALVKAKDVISSKLAAYSKTRREDEGEGHKTHTKSKRKHTRKHKQMRHFKKHKKTEKI